MSEEENNYLKHVEECKLNSAVPLSEEDFNNKSVKFLPPAVSAGAGSLMLNATQRFVTKLAAGTKPSEAIKSALTEEGVKLVNNVRGESIKIILGDKKGGSSGSSGGGSSSSPIPGFESNSNDNYLTGVYNTNPLSMSLDTNINARVYSDAFNYPLNAAATFCHITGYKLTFATTTYINDYWDKVLMPYLQNKAQLAVNFKVDLSLFTFANFLSYFITICDALSTYYFYTSIISYCSVPTNPDRGMHALRAMISATDIDYLSQLNLQLRSVPIPPNLNKLCFWLYQTYTDGPNSQGLVKFMPIGFNGNVSGYNVTGFGNNSQLLKEMVQSFGLINQTGLVPMLTKVLPNWVNDKIYDPSPVPLYSPDFLTVWANSCYTGFGGGTQITGPEVADANAKLKTYCSFSPNPDGLTVGLQSVKVASSTEFINGLFKPVSTVSAWGNTNYFCNRFSYVNTSTNDYTWQMSNQSIEAAFGRLDTRKLYQNIGYFTRIPDTFLISNADGNLFNMVGRDLLTWMMSLETVPDKQKKFFDSTKPKGK